MVSALFLARPARPLFFPPPTIERFPAQICLEAGSKNKVHYREDQEIFNTY
jgi:hypothetical protein